VGLATREMIVRLFEVVAAFEGFLLVASGEVFTGCLDISEIAIDGFGAVEVRGGFFGVDETLLDGFEVVEALFAAFVDTAARFGAVEGLEVGFLTEAVSPLASERIDRKDISTYRYLSVRRVYCCWVAMRGHKLRWIGSDASCRLRAEFEWIQLRFVKKNDKRTMGNL